ncbi:MAG: UDP-N-acetylmuramate--L-alanine ligase [Thermoanaerobaculales bacterium]|nr:UDP-N-acetylmuramate--L-alanine ligase [Thermoanaerobaculales bacterium]
MRPRWGPIRHVHFVGIGGVGMCALAEVLLDDGLAVSGCDSAESERTRRLAARGAVVALGHDPRHVAEAEALVVSAAVPVNHPELEAARSAGIPIVRRAELLAEVVRGYTSVAVAGTHGKTTTAALLTHILHKVGASPTSVVGGRVSVFDAYGRRGRGSTAVCEADEFDRAFLELEPIVAIITNVESDHLDYYGSDNELRSAFQIFAAKPPFHGSVLLCGDDPGASALAGSTRASFVTYGLGAANELRAVDLSPENATTSFTVLKGKRRLGCVRLPLAGEHNVQNALGALGAGLQLGFEFADLAEAFTDFKGVDRRFELLGSRRGVTVMDDYAHHPTEIEATLAAARQNFPERPLTVVFQPHLFSRTRDLWDDFGRVLSRVEHLVVLPIFAAREEPISGINHRMVMSSAVAHGCGDVVESGSVEETSSLIDGLLEPGAVLLTLGAGDVDRVGKIWLEESA